MFRMCIYNFLMNYILNLVIFNKKKEIEKCRMLQKILKINI